MKPETITDIVDLAWEDIRAAGDGSEKGIIAIIVHRTDDGYDTHVASTLPPMAVKAVVHELALSWRLKPSRFQTIAKTRKKAT